MPFSYEEDDVREYWSYCGAIEVHTVAIILRCCLLALGSRTHHTAAASGQGNCATC